MPTNYNEDRTLKRCTGPAHDGDGVWLPANTEYFYLHKSGRKAGRLHYRCKLCTNWEKLNLPPHTVGLVSVEKAWPFVYELVGRLGLMEAHRRTTVAPNILKDILDKRRTKVRKRTLRKILIELVKARQNNEVRHKDSIHHGSALRGRKEKKPVRTRDFNHRIW